MKWAFIFLTLTLCFASADAVFAQRTLPGQRGLQLTAGSVNASKLQDGFYSGIAFSQYAKGADRWVFGVEYMEKRHTYKGIKIPQSQFTAEGGYFLNFLSDPRKTVFVSLGASAMAGYETVNRSEKLLFDGATVNNSEAFLYGGAVTLECEIYLTNRLVLQAGVRERLLMGSSVGKTDMQIGLGIKIIIN